MLHKRRHHLIALVCLLVSASLLASTWDTIEPVHPPEKSAVSADGTYLAEMRLTTPYNGNNARSLWDGERQVAWFWSTDPGAPLAFVLDGRKELKLCVQEGYEDKVLVERRFQLLPALANDQILLPQQENFPEMRIALKVQQRAAPSTWPWRLERRVRSRLDDPERAQKLARDCFAEEHIRESLKDPKVTHYFTFATPEYVYIELYFAGVSTNSRGYTPGTRRLQVNLYEDEVVISNFVGSVYSLPDGTPLPDEPGWGGDDFKTDLKFQTAFLEKHLLR